MRQKESWFTTSWISRCQEDDRNSLISGGLTDGGACFDHELMVFSWLFPSVTLSDTPGHSVTLSCCDLFILSCRHGVKSVSFLLLSDRYHDEGSHIELFFSSNQRWPPGYYHSRYTGREGGRLILSTLWVLVFYKIYNKPWVPSLQSLMSLLGKFAFSNELYFVRQVNIIITPLITTVAAPISRQGWHRTAWLIPSSSFVITTGPCQ